MAAPTADELLEAARIESERLREIERIERYTEAQENRKGVRVRRGEVQVTIGFCCGSYRWAKRVQ